MPKTTFMMYAILDQYGCYESMASTSLKQAKSQAKEHSTQVKGEVKLIRYDRSNCSKYHEIVAKFVDGREYNNNKE